VRRPGAYELLEDEGFETLLEFAGGYTAEARTDEVTVTSLAERPATGRVTRYVPADEMDQLELADRDVIRIGSVTEREPVVFLEGALGQEGSQPAGSTRVSRTISADARVSDVARAASSLFTAVSDLENAYLRRAEGEIVPIDLIDLLYGTGSLTADPVVEHEDVLVIPFKQLQVTVLGAVARPGSYPYVPNKTWRYYIEQAGGFNLDLNDRQQVEIVDADDVPVSKDEAIGPEYTIRAARNDARFWYLRTADLTTTTIELFNAIYGLLQTFGLVQ
jgi:protein involved in polysaccharide export with SLBB domain